MLNLIDPVAAGSAPAALSPAKSMGKQEFLRLLVAQLEHQNPLEPLDGTDFAAQLAQFSSLEQLFDINSGLQQLAGQQSAMGKIGALGLIGKRVRAEGDQVALAEEGSATGRYRLDVPAEVAVAVYDAEGNLVRTLKAGLVQPGEHEFRWDGLSESAARCPAGPYRFRVVAFGLDGEQAAATTYILGTVSGVELDGSEPRLIIGDEATGNKKVALSDLREVLN